MSRQGIFVGVFSLGAMLGACPSRAAAAPILITHGDTISDMGTVPPELRAAKMPATRVGFKYSYFGVFWIDLWTWNGQWGLYEGRRFWAVPAATVAQFLGKNESELSPPFLYTFPLGLVLLVGFGVFVIGARLLHRPPPNPVRTLLEDDRYREALQVYVDRVSAPDPPPPPRTLEASLEAEPPPDPAALDARRQEKIAAAYQAAIGILMSRGIERAQAEEQFSFLLAATQPQSPGPEAPAPEQEATPQ